MLQPQLINLLPPAAAPPRSAVKAAVKAASATDTMFSDVIVQKNESLPPPAEKPTEKNDDNLLAFSQPTLIVPPADEHPELGQKVKVYHPDLFRITQAIVSVLERYPNNTPPDSEIVPLLEEYLRQSAQLGVELPQNMRDILDEVLARMPQTEDIGALPPKQDKLAQLIDLFRGYLYPLENVNEADPEQKIAQIIPIRPPEEGADTADAKPQDGEGERQRESKRPGAETPAHLAGARIDIQPHKVLFAERLAATQPRFMPLTADNLFETMIERIVALPDAEPHMEIALKPDHLGKLSIDLQLGQNGLTAKIIASDEGVRNMLAANLSRLSESLAEKGIRVENVEIVYSALADKPFDQRQPQQEQEGNKHNRLDLQTLWGATEAAPAWWDAAYNASAYTDAEWGLGLSSVEYHA